MTKINTQIKTQEIIDLGNQGVVPETGNTNETDDTLKADVEGALVAIEEFKDENLEWLTEENLNELERIETMLKAESAAMDGYGYGMYGPGAVDPTAWELPQELDPLWNGIPEDHINPYGEDANRLAEDPARYGEYMGTVEIPNSGDVAMPTNIGFQMTDDMNALYAESRGRDIIVTAEYTDGSRKSWVVRDGSVRTEPLVLSGIGLSHGVTIDCHRVYRHGGQPLYIHGTEFDDTIRGSQGDDGIIGYAGADNIDAGAGDDRVYGDEYYEYSGQFDPAYGGDDIIAGGAGNDILYGGAGLDTQFTSDSSESVNEFERTENDVSVAPPDPSAWFQSEEWAISDSEDGVLTFQNMGNGEGGDIKINLEQMPGYNMAYGDMDADGSMIITFVGDEGMFKIKLEDFFTEQFNADDPTKRIVRLNMQGASGSDIMHFANVNVTSQIINLLGGAGEDIILGATNQMLADGVDPSKLTKSQKNGSGILNGHVNAGVFAADEEHPYNEDGSLNKWCGYEATEQNGQIVISEDSSYGDERVPELCLKAPEGYTNGYITSDNNGDIYVILVKPTASGSAKTIVYKIDESLRLDYDHIIVKNEVTLTTSEVDSTEFKDLGAPFTLTAVSMDESDYVIDGQAGEDLIFAPKGTKVADDEREIVWQDILSAPPMSPPSLPSGGSTPQATTPESDDGGDNENPEGDGGSDNGGNQ